MGIHASYPPSPEQLARLADTRDADLIAREFVPSLFTRGRGAKTNATGRFENAVREAFDDGWDLSEEGGDRDTHVHEERAKTIIARNASPDIPFDRSINPYRGCEHGCSYCFARPTHAYLGMSAGLDFEREIFVKTNAAERLRAELAKPRYAVRPIALGTNTDPYQPVERKYRLMRGILEVLAETKHPVTIVTKGALVTRDIDILSDMAKDNLVSVAMSVTTLDARLSRTMEPRAAAPDKRLAAISALAAAGIPVAAMVAPIIPAINDSEIEKIVEAVAAQGAKSVGYVMLRLPNEVRDIFREWLLAHFPDRLAHVMSRIRDLRDGRDNDPNFGSRMKGSGPYAFAIRQRFDLVRRRLSLNKRMPALRTDLFVPPKIASDQLSLF